MQNKLQAFIALDLAFNISLIKALKQEIVTMLHMSSVMEKSDLHLRPL
jgi:hypothetical protein